MASEPKKARKPDFTDEEIRCLLETIGQEKQYIQCNLQRSLRGRRKQFAWDRVLFQLTSCSSGIVRNYEEIKMKWKYLKTAVMKKQASQKQTGGGGQMKETLYKEPILYVVCDRSDVMPGIQGLYGTNGCFVCCNFLCIL